MEGAQPNRRRTNMPWYYISLLGNRTKHNNNEDDDDDARISTQQQLHRNKCQGLQIMKDCLGECCCSHGSHYCAHTLCYTQHTPRTAKRRVTAWGRRGMEVDVDALDVEEACNMLRYFIVQNSRKSQSYLLLTIRIFRARIVSVP